MSESQKNEILESGDLDRIRSFVSGMQSGADILREQRDGLESENARLRDALQKIYDADDWIQDGSCHWCSYSGPDGIAHADDCPFKGQEGNDGSTTD